MKNKQKSKKLILSPYYSYKEVREYRWSFTVDVIREEVDWYLNLRNNDKNNENKAQNEILVSISQQKIRKQYLQVLSINIIRGEIVRYSEKNLEGKAQLPYSDAN